MVASIRRQQDSVNIDLHANLTHAFHCFLNLITWFCYSFIGHPAAIIISNHYLHRLTAGAIRHGNLYHRLLSNVGAFDHTQIDVRTLGTLVPGAGFWSTTVPGGYWSLATSLTWPTCSCRLWIWAVTVSSDEPRKSGNTICCGPAPWLITKSIAVPLFTWAGGRGF